MIMDGLSYQRDWGKQCDRPTITDKIPAFVLKLLPPAAFC
jgi:hypothetical protein